MLQYKNLFLLMHTCKHKLLCSAFISIKKQQVLLSTYCAAIAISLEHLYSSMHGLFQYLFALIFLIFFCFSCNKPSYYDTFLSKYQELARQRNWKQPLLSTCFFCGFLLKKIKKNKK